MSHWPDPHRGLVVSEVACLAAHDKHPVAGERDERTVAAASWQRGQRAPGARHWVEGVRVLAEVCGGTAECACREKTVTSGLHQP